MLQRKKTIDHAEVAALERGLAELRAISNALREDDSDASSDTEQASPSTSPVKKQTTLTALSPHFAAFLSLHTLTTFLLQGFGVQVSGPGTTLRFTTCPVSTIQGRVLDATNSPRSFLSALAIAPDFLHGLLALLSNPQPQASHSQILTVAAPLLEPFTIATLSIATHFVIDFISRCALASKPRADKANPVKAVSFALWASIASNALYLAQSFAVVMLTVGIMACISGIVGSPISTTC